MRLLEKKIPLYIGKQLDVASFDGKMRQHRIR